MYDPQPQHVDALGAQNSLFGKLIVSGWHTAAMAMRLKLDGMFARIATGFVGLGMEQVRWPHPLFPGDDIYIRVTVLQARVSKSRTGHGVIEYRVEVFNQHDVLVMHMLITALVPCRPV
jgi:acyl dehydratase